MQNGRGGSPAHEDLTSLPITDLLCGRISNFSSDVEDGENYTILLNQLAPDTCSRAPLQTPDLLQRVEQILMPINWTAENSSPQPLL